jgi:hypothetical protein
MNNEVKKDLLIGILFGFISTLEYEKTERSLKIYEKIMNMIEQIYYPKKDLSQPTVRGE